jgi:hypothetical protein
MTTGYLAEKFGKPLEIQICRSAAGYYIGTLDEGMPNTRESVEYFRTKEEAETALQDGYWSQRYHP